MVISSVSIRLLSFDSKKHQVTEGQGSDQSILSLPGCVKRRKATKGFFYLDHPFSPAGYNLGINVGVEAGQTVMHVHLHLIPRYRGDVADPRGGVRGVIPAKQNYTPISSMEPLPKSSYFDVMVKESESL